MNTFLFIAAIFAIIVCITTLGAMLLNRKFLGSFRSTLKPGQLVTVEYKGELQPAEIQNIHNGLVFCWLNYYGCFTYVEFNKIFPDDYK